jgi:RimJ/RimL family protein N-acetyltransferase
MIGMGLLKGETVRLTALEDEDISTISLWYSDADFLRYFDKVPAYPKGKQELLEWVRKVREGANSFPFAIRPLDSDEMVGYIELDNVQWWNGVATLGIGIGSNEHRGKGIGKEALNLVLEFAFKELNLHRVQLNVFSYNEKAISMYEKAGFKREGVYREFVSRDGERWDMYLYGILKSEWLNTRIL